MFELGPAALKLDTTNALARLKLAAACIVGPIQHNMQPTCLQQYMKGGGSGCPDFAEPEKALSIVIRAREKRV